MLAQLPPMMEVLLSRHESDGNRKGGPKRLKLHVPIQWSVFLGVPLFLPCSLCLSFFLFQTAFMEARKQTRRQSRTQIMVTSATFLLFQPFISKSSIYAAQLRSLDAQCVCVCLPGVLAQLECLFFFFLLEQTLLVFAVICLSHGTSRCSVASLEHLESVWVEVS